MTSSNQSRASSSDGEMHAHGMIARARLVEPANVIN
jgi:hypothetical protein